MGNFRQIKFCQWEILTECNMRCKGCRVWEKISEQPDLELVIAGIDDLAAAGIENLEIIGGEPFVYRKAPEMLRYLNIQQKIKRFAILTNATMIDDIRRVKSELSHKKGGLVVSINYTPKQCEQLLELGIDVGMAQKSLAGWKALEEFKDVCWIRVNCAVNTLNIQTLSQIALRVVQLGAKFSFCPLMYRRQGCDSGLELTFRSATTELALLLEYKEAVKEAMAEMIELKRRYPDQIIPTVKYMHQVVESCKMPTQPYPASCKNMGLPYLRVSSEIGKSLFDENISFRLRACSDIKGAHISKIVTSDLRYPEVRERLSLIYPQDPRVVECCNSEGCIWSVTHVGFEN